MAGNTGAKRSGGFTGGSSGGFAGEVGLCVRTLAEASESDGATCVKRAEAARLL